MKIVDLIVWHANYCKVTRNITPPPDGLDISIGIYFFLGVLSLDAADCCNFTNAEKKLENIGRGQDSNLFR